MLTLCPNFIKFTLKFSCFSLHLDLRDWKPFCDRSSEHLRTFSAMFGRLRKWLLRFRKSQSCRRDENLAQSTVRKKMAAVHFTTIPCESNAANRHIESHIFYEILSCTNSIVYARFEVFKSFLCVFRVFVRNELWVKLPVAIFFGTVDLTQKKLGGVQLTAKVLGILTHTCTRLELG